MVLLKNWGAKRSAECLCKKFLREKKETGLRAFLQPKRRPLKEAFMSISKVFHTLVGDKSIVLQFTEFHDDHIIFRGLMRVNAKKCPCWGGYKGVGPQFFRRTININLDPAV